MKNAKGFTLVELMFVVVILGLLVSLAVPYFGGTTDKVKLTEFKPVLKQAIVLYEAYYEEKDTYVTGVGNIANGNREIGFTLPKAETRFAYSSVETEKGVVVTARLKKDLKEYKAGMGADLNQDYEKNTVTKDIPW